MQQKQMPLQPRGLEWGRLCPAEFCIKSGLQPLRLPPRRQLGFPDNLDVAVLVGGSAFGSGDLRVAMGEQRIATAKCTGPGRPAAWCSGLILSLGPQKLLRVAHAVLR